MDLWWINHISGVDEEQPEKRISFEVVGGGQGNISPSEMVLHLVNHPTNDRGHVGEMMCKTDYEMGTYGLSIYLRDAQQKI